MQFLTVYFFDIFSKKIATCRLAGFRKVGFAPKFRIEKTDKFSCQNSAFINFPFPSILDSCNRFNSE